VGTKPVDSESEGSAEITLGAKRKEKKSTIERRLGKNPIYFPSCSESFTKR